MEQNNLYRYYVFGFNYALLRSFALSNLTRVKAIEQLNLFLKNLDRFDLAVTKVVAADLIMIKDELALSKDDDVPAAITTRAKQAVERLDPSLDAELQLRVAYVLTKKRHDLTSLMEKPSELLGQGTWNTLTPTSQQDFTLGCRQIALNQPTAAAFHLMRTLEEQVKVLYFAFRKTKRLAKPMWGPMTAELRAKKAPKPSEKLLAHLDGMRIHFRNPTQHPDHFYTLDEAEDLLNQTIVAMGMICAEMPKKAAAA